MLDQRLTKEKSQLIKIQQQQKTELLLKMEQLLLPIKMVQQILLQLQMWHVQTSLRLQSFRTLMQLNEKSMSMVQKRTHSILKSKMMRIRLRQLRCYKVGIINSILQKAKLIKSILSMDIQPTSLKLKRLRRKRHQRLSGTQVLQKQQMV